MNIVPQESLVPRYATLLYPVRQKLDISWAEYVYLDMVYHLDRNGWCYKSLESVAKDMGMAKSGVVKMRERLISKNLLKKSKNGHVKTTVMYHKVILADKSSYHKVNEPYHKVERGVPLSGTKNNNRNTLEKRTGKYKDVSLAEMYRQHLNGKSEGIAKAQVSC